MSWREVLELLTWRDLVDVLVVALLFYNLLLLIRGTRAVQMLLGLLFVVGVYYLARLADLPTLQTLVQSFLIFLPFAAIVLFQHEIRRALANLGRGPLVGRGSRQQTESTFHEIVLAANSMAARKVGALIVIERTEGLRTYVEAGIALDAVVSYDLLINVFTPDTPLHDGAVIVQSKRIAAAACFLPLTANPDIAKELGTRHRAAVGISEETDAVAVVVSEETGMLALAFGGELVRDLDERRLHELLVRHLVTDLSRLPRRAA